MTSSSESLREPVAPPARAAAAETGPATAARGPDVRVSDLVIAYESAVAVDHLDLEIAGGTCFGVVGPNGAGKTSTLHAIAGILTPSGGSITVGQDEPVVGIAPQELALYPQLTVRQNLEFFGRIAGLGRRALAGRIAAVVEVVALGDHLDRRVARLSTGTKRRLNFGAAILREPDVLLLDEPTVGVDPQSKALLADYVRTGLAGRTTVIYSTHLMHEVEQLCDRVAIIDHGRIIASGPVAELIARHARPAFELTVDGTVDAATLAALDGAAELLGAVDGTAAGEHRIRFEADSTGAGLARAGRWAAGHDVALREVEVLNGSLERVFLDLTGRRLRDEVGDDPGVESWLYV